MKSYFYVILKKALLFDKKIWYNRNVFVFKKVGENMSNEEKFQFDIENIKKDFAIEDMTISKNVIELLKKYNDKEITMDKVVNFIINE